MSVSGSDRNFPKCGSAVLAFAGRCQMVSITSCSLRRLGCMLYKGVLVAVVKSRFYSRDGAKMTE